MNLKEAKKKVKGGIDRNRMYPMPGTDYAANAFERCRNKLSITDLVKFQAWYTNLITNPHSK